MQVDRKKTGSGKEGTKVWESKGNVPDKRRDAGEARPLICTGTPLRAGGAGAKAGMHLLGVGYRPVGLASHCGFLSGSAERAVRAAGMKRGYL